MSISVITLFFVEMRYLHNLILRKKEHIERK